MRCSSLLRPTALVLLGTLAGAGAASAKTCELKIDGTDAMQYSTKELVVAKDCTDVTVTLKHTGKLPKASMGHNWILAAEADVQPLLGVAMGAGLAADYTPKDDKRVIAHTKLVGGGEETSTTFKMADLKAGTKYKYFCSFPGHAGLMTGVLTVK